MKPEIEKTILSLKNNKAPDPDNIYGEALKLIYEMDDQFLHTLTDLFNNIYNTGEFPKDWVESTFISVLKKRGAKKCDEFRLISLINHITKVLTKVIYYKIYRKCKANISESQFSFRNALGTREAIFNLQVLIQRCRGYEQRFVPMFLDFAKAFDNVRHERLMKILQKAGIDGKDIRIIVNLY